MNEGSNSEKPHNSSESVPGLFPESGRDPVLVAEIFLLLQKAVSDELNEEEAERFLFYMEKHPVLKDMLAREMLSDCLLHDLYALDPPESEFGEDWSDLEQLVEMAAKATAIPKTVHIQEEPVDSEQQRDESVRNFVSKMPEQPKSYRSSYATPRIIAFCTFALIAVAVCAYFFLDRKTHDFSDPLEKSAIAVMTRCDDVVWHDEEPPPVPGQTLSNCSLRFESGSVELLFYNGARTVVEGPAEFTLLGRKKVFCTAGKWSATVPAQGSGFEIRTPQGTIRDIGTEFYASIDPDHCDLEVIKGIVEFEGMKGSKRTLETGRRMTMHANEVFNTLPALPARFVTSDEMKQRCLAFFQRKTELPESEFQSLLDLKFDTDKKTKGFTFHGGELIDCDIDGVPGKVVRLLESNDRIRLKSCGKIPAATFSMRIRIDSLSDTMNPILMSEGSERGGLTWHVSRQGSILVGIRSRKDRSAATFESPVVFTEERLGKWVRLDLSLDTVRGKLLLCIDEDPVLVRELPHLPHLNLEKPDIGNWSPHGYMRLDAAIERVRIFDRYFTLEEIRSMEY